MVKNVVLSNAEVAEIVTALECRHNDLREDEYDDPGGWAVADEASVATIGHLLGRFAVLANHDEVPA